MKIKEKTLRIAKFFIRNQCTIREAAANLGVPKSTVFEALIRVEEYDETLYQKARNVLENNKKIKHFAMNNR